MFMVRVQEEHCGSRKLDNNQTILYRCLAISYHGFTPIELVVAIAVIGFLLTIAFSRYSHSAQNSSETGCSVNIKYAPGGNLLRIGPEDG